MKDEAPSEPVYGLDVTSSSALSAQWQGSPYGSNSGVAAKWGGGQRVDGTAWEGWWGLVRQKIGV